MMTRRAFLGTLGLLAAPRAAEAQPAGKVWRIGYLTPAEIPRAPLVAGLRTLGYVDGQTVRLEIRSAENDLDRLPALAAELVRARVDIIVAVSPPAIVAAKQATATIPVVMAFWGGERIIESGVVASFTRPGGNVTGVYMFAAELDAKRLELLLQAVPKARRVGVLNPGPGWSVTHLRPVANSHRIQLVLSDVPGPHGYDPAFAGMSKARVDAVLVPSFPRFYREHALIVQATAKRRMPAVYEWAEIVRAGGLIAYGPVLEDLNHLVAMYVDKILKGSKPADLPVEQPTKFELVINLKTAKALGLTIPPSVLARADQVIE
jgi:putative tryptophan/tyrosine transport system substrate-binding protein